MTQFPGAELESPRPAGRQIERRMGGWSRDYFAHSIIVPAGAQLIFLAGIGASGLAVGAEPFPGDAGAQARHIYQELADQLAEVGASVRDIVKITTYVTDARFIDDVTQARLAAFDGQPLSVHTFVVVAALAWPDMLVEVDATAAVVDPPVY